MSKYYRKSAFVKNVWPVNSALFIYVSTHCFETVKWPYYNRYSQLTRWYNGYTSVLGARGPGFNSQLWLGFFMFDFFVLLLLLCFYFLSQNTLFVTKLCNSLFNVNLFSMLKILTDL